MGRVVWVAVAAIWLAPLLGGTADRPYTLLLAAAGALACIFSSLGAGLRQPLRLSWFHAWLGLATLATLLQCVPLPPALRALLAPGSDADLRAIVSGLGAAGRWWPLSPDVGATLHEAVRLAGYLGLLTALGECEDRVVRTAVLGSAALCAGLGLLAGLGVPLPAPIAVPGGGATRALFPAGLYNSNHMAALAGIGALLALDASQRHAVLGRRLGFLALAALCDVVLVGTLSRAGIVVWLAAQLALVAWPRRSGGWRLLVWPLVALTVLLAGVLTLGDSTFGLLQRRFADSSLPSLTAPGGKLHAWLDAGPLLAGHWLLGAGRGAFENTFQHLQPLAGRTRFVYLENEWLQAVVDWGVPVALALFTLLALALRDSWQARHERRWAKPALLGLAGLAVHNLFDFNLEVGGVAVAALGLVALCEKQRFPAPRWLPVAVAGITLAGALLVTLRFPSHDEDGAQLRAVCARPTATPDEVLTAGRDAVLRHPLDSYLPALVAARLAADPHAQAQAEAVTWINRALIANPHDVLAQHTGARLLIERGYRTQGLLLFRQALGDADDPQHRRLLQSLASLAQGPDEIFAALPAPAMAVELLELLVTSAAPPWPPWPLVQAVGERACELRLRGAGIWLGRAALALRDSRSALHAGQALLREPGEVPGRLMADLVDLLAAAGQTADAEALVRAALGRGERAELLLSQAQLAEKRDAFGEARQLLEQALSRSSDAGLRAHIHEVYGDLEARAGNLHQASSHRLEAARLRASP